MHPADLKSVCFFLQLVVNRNTFQTCTESEALITFIIWWYKMMPILGKRSVRSKHPRPTSERSINLITPPERGIYGHTGHC